MKGIIILCLIIGGGYFAYTKMPQSATQLHGEWQATYDPDNPNSEETFQLTSDGEFITDTGFRCVYAHVAESELAVECTVKGKKKELMFDVSADKKVITNPSGATYEKI